MPNSPNDCIICHAEFDAKQEVCPHGTTPFNAERVTLCPNCSVKLYPPSNKYYVVPRYKCPVSDCEWSG